MYVLETGVQAILSCFSAAEPNGEEKDETNIQESENKSSMIQRKEIE